MGTSRIKDTILFLIQFHLVLTHWEKKQNWCIIVNCLPYLFLSLCQILSLRQRADTAQGYELGLFKNNRYCKNSVHAYFVFRMHYYVSKSNFWFITSGVIIRTIEGYGIWSPADNISIATILKKTQLSTKSIVCYKTSVISVGSA